MSGSSSSIPLTSVGGPVMSTLKLLLYMLYFQFHLFKSVWFPPLVVDHREVIDKHMSPFFLPPFLFVLQNHS